MKTKLFRLNADQILQIVPGRGSCIASDEITVVGKAVGYMYREASADWQSTGRLHVSEPSETKLVPEHSGKIGRHPPGRSGSRSKLSPHSRTPASTQPSMLGTCAASQADEILSSRRAHKPASSDLDELQPLSTTTVVPLFFHGLSSRSFRSWTPSAGRSTSTTFQTMPRSTPKYPWINRSACRPSPSTARQGALRAFPQRCASRPPR